MEEVAKQSSHNAKREATGPSKNKDRLMTLENQIHQRAPVHKHRENKPHGGEETRLRQTKEGSMVGGWGADLPSTLDPNDEGVVVWGAEGGGGRKLRHMKGRRKAHRNNKRQTRGACVVGLFRVKTNKLAFNCGWNVSLSKTIDMWEG